MRKINVLCDAVPFCFGPISKMISVANYLDKNKANLTLLASGTSLELGKKSKLFKVVECNSEDESDLDKQSNLFDSADVFITVMNPVAASFALKKNVPVIYLDSLFWMWDNVPKEFSKFQKYFVQNFFSSKEALAKYPHLKNVEFVGPIINDSFSVTEKKEDYVVVNFGGMESALIQVGKNSNYPFVVGKIVLDALKKSKQKAYVCGNAKILKKLMKFAPKNVKVGGKSHSEFLEILRKAKLIITTPGLTTTFESFYYKTPAVFLPPENYSQFLNLKEFRNKGVANLSFHWLDVYPNVDLISGEEEKSGVDKVLSRIKAFESDKSAQEKLELFLEEVLNKKVSNKDQEKYLLSLGNTSSKKIAEYVLNNTKKRVVL